MIKEIPIDPQPSEGFRLWGPVHDGRALWTDHPLQGEKGNIIRATCPYAPGDTYPHEDGDFFVVDVTAQHSADGWKWVVSLESIATIVINAARYRR